MRGYLLMGTRATDGGGRKNHGKPASPPTELGANKTSYASAKIGDHCREAWLSRGFEAEAEREAEQVAGCPRRFQVDHLPGGNHRAGKDAIRRARGRRRSLQESMACG